MKHRLVIVDLRRRFIAVVAVAALSAAACGGGSDESSVEPDAEDQDAAPAATGEGTDPCSLVTVAEAEAILGPVEEPSEGGAGVIFGQRACAFSLADGQPAANVAIMTRRTPDHFERFTAEIEDKLGDELQPVAGLGDDARWFDRRRILLVLVGDEILTVQLMPPGGGPAARDRAVALAEAAVAQL